MSNQIVLSDDMRDYFASLPVHIQNMVLQSNFKIKNRIQLQECVERLMREKEFLNDL